MAGKKTSQDISKSIILKLWLKYIKFWTRPQCDAQVWRFLRNKIRFGETEAHPLSFIWIDRYIANNINIVYIGNWLQTKIWSTHIWNVSYPNSRFGSWGMRINRREGVMEKWRVSYPKKTLSTTVKLHLSWRIFPLDA